MSTTVRRRGIDAAVGGSLTGRRIVPIGKQRPQPGNFRLCRRRMPCFCVRPLLRFCST